MKLQFVDMPVCAKLTWIWQTMLYCLNVRNCRVSSLELIVARVTVWVSCLVTGYSAATVDKWPCIREIVLIASYSRILEYTPSTDIGLPGLHELSPMTPSTDMQTTCLWTAKKLIVQRFQANFLVLFYWLASFAGSSSQQPVSFPFWKSNRGASWEVPCFQRQWPEKNCSWVLSIDWSRETSDTCDANAGTLEATGKCLNLLVVHMLYSFLGQRLSPSVIYKAIKSYSLYKEI